MLNNTTPCWPRCPSQGLIPGPRPPTLYLVHGLRTKPKTLNSMVYYLPTYDDVL